MIRASIIFSIFFFFSCADPAGNSSDSESASTDEVVLDSDRLNAVEINNEFIGMYDGMTGLITELFLSDSASVEINFENALFESKSILDRLFTYKLEDQDESFKNALIDLEKFYESELETEFKSLIPLIKNKSLSDEEIERLENYDQSFADKEKELILSFAAAQEAFAQRNNIRLE